MAATKYELKANTNSAEIWVADKRIRLEGDTVYSTSNPAEIRALDEWDAVKAAETTSKKAGS